MGEHDKKPAKKAATAGPSEDDRFGAGPICTNAEARIIKYDVVGGRLRITIAKGASHGARDNLPGYIKSGRGMLADFYLEGVRDAVSYAFVPLTPDQLAGHLYVVINPASFPSAVGPGAGQLATRVIAVAVDSDPPRGEGRTKITIPYGTTDGVTEGMRGQLRSSNGGRTRDFTIWSAIATQSFAYLREPVDFVNAHPDVVLFPNTVPSRAPIQRRANGTASAADVQATAQAGVAGATRRLPHLDVIQRAFGKHDISGVQAQVGGAAADASAALGAQAYATGDKVAFASAPDLHTAAHEAAHVIQQQRGAVGFQGLGAADDEHERHADAVADAVVAGQSAEPLLDQLSGVGSASVQRKWSPRSDIASLRAELEGMQELVLRRVVAADAYLKAGLPALAAMELSISRAVTNYAIAHDQHRRVVEKGKAAAADKDSLISDFVGIGTGVAIGLLMSAMLPASLAVGVAVMAELAGEVGDLFVNKGIGKLTNHDANAIKPLAGGSDAFKTAHYARLLQLYRGLALTGSEATSAALVLNGITQLIGQARLLHAGAPADLTSDDLRERLGRLRRIPTEIPYRSGPIEEIRLVVNKHAHEKGADVRIPDARLMEQYIWIRWIAQFGFMDDDGRYTYRNSDVLDNDTIEGYLHNSIGVLGPHGVLGVDFGSYTSEADEQRAIRAAKEAWGIIYSQMRGFLEPS